MLTNYKSQIGRDRDMQMRVVTLSAGARWTFVFLKDICVMHEILL